MSETAAIVRHEPQPMAMTPESVRGQVNLIQKVMKEVMQPGQHYGTIPGCGPKPALLKAGAEKLSMVFRLAPSFKIEIENFEHGHREYRIICTLNHIVTGDVWGQGVGSCSTMETKFRYRGGSRKCPQCGKETIIKGKAEYGGGWVCFAKKGGCGAKWGDGAKEIEGQEIGRSENPDIADQYNTVLKMAKKRAQVDATLTATAASDCFTQDVDERIEDAGGEEVHANPAPAAKVTASTKGPTSTAEACFDALAAKMGDSAWDTFIVQAENGMNKPAANFTGQDWAGVMESIRLIPAKAPSKSVAQSEAPASTGKAAPKPFKPQPKPVEAVAGEEDAPF